MRCAVRAYGNTRVAAHDFDIESAVRYCASYLFPSSACRENGKGTGKGSFSPGSEAGGKAYKVLFRYPYVEKSFREFLGKLVCLRRA